MATETNETRHDTLAYSNDKDSFVTKPTGETTGERNVLLKGKLILGFGGLILLMALNIGIAMFKMTTIESSAITVIENRQPMVVNLLGLSENLNLATTYLNGYLLTGNVEHKTKYQKLAKKIDNQLRELKKDKKYQRIEVEDRHIEKISELLKEFNGYANQLIFVREDVRKNYPALALAEKTLNASALGYLGLTGNLLSELKDEKPSEQRQQVLVLLSELRYTWLQMMNNLRIYFNSRAKSNLDDLKIYDEQNQVILKQMKDMNIDIGFGGLAQLEAYSEEWHSHLDEVIALVKGEAWRADAYIMRTEVQPIVDQLREMLLQLSQQQLAASREDGKSLTESLSEIRWSSGVIFVFSAVLGIVLALIITRTIIPPLSRLVCAAREVSEGNLNIDLENTSMDEVGQLTHSFNTMVQALRQAAVDEERLRNELTEWNQQLEQRVKDKVNELQSTQNQLLQSEKLASIGQLAAGVAHEINNPVGYINSNVGTLRNYIEDIFSVLDRYQQLENNIENKQLLDDVTQVKQKVELNYLRDDIKDLIEESQEGVTRVKQIVKDLKDFSHVDEAEWQMADLHKGLNSTLNIAHNEIKYKAEVEREYGDLPSVECMPSQINQVFMNLIVNAAHAIEGKGVIRVHTSSTDDEVLIAVSDNGKGIPEDVRARIFEPFFTTKVVGQGTGLGLSLSYGIVEKHHGSIEVDSEVGVGTTFRVRLPIKQPTEDSSGLQNTNAA